jgi:HYDIN/CFA65/VesB family protein
VNEHAITDGDTSEFSDMVAANAIPAASVSPTAIDFGNVAAGSVSPQRTSTITSVGGADYQITGLSNIPSCDGGSICQGSSFLCSTTCSTSTPYAPGSSCSVSASFAPASIGLQSTTIYICDNADSSKSITLSANAVIPPPVLISPSAFDFGSIQVGRQSGTHLFGVRNPGAVAIDIGTPSVGGPFGIEFTSCGPTLGPGATCSVQVFFAPQLAGHATGALNIPVATVIPERAPAGSKQLTPSSTVNVAASLQGTGVQSPQLTAPDSLDFGAVSLGDTPAHRTVELRNDGSAPLTLSSITLTGAAFTMTNGCPASLAPAEACSLEIDFAPTVLGDITGAVSIASNAPGGLRTIALSGLAQVAPLPLIRVSPHSMGFGDRLIGTTSATQRVTITNVGGVDAALTGLNPSAGFLVTGTTCSLTLAPQATCFADVAMRPVGFGLRIGQFVVSSNSADSPIAVNLSGNGCRPFSVSINRLGGSGFNCSP